MNQKKMFITICCVIVAIIAVIFFCDGLVSYKTSSRTYDDPEEIPHNTYGLLLGTSPVTRQGTHNYMFVNRIKAAVTLFNEGKIDTIIASGGSYKGTEKHGCDEPQAMKDSLIARGVPADRILLDYDGTRTLKSIENAKNTYGLDTVTLISQKFHNERAIYLADRKGIQTIGYNAAASPILKSRIKNRSREYLARVKMFIDLARGDKEDK